MKSFALASLLLGASADLCSHTTCSLVKNRFGSTTIVIKHSNVEGVCSQYQTTQTPPLAHTVQQRAGAKVHCGRVKHWITSTNGAHAGAGAGHWDFSGACECHAAGSHPNGKAGMAQLPNGKDAPHGEAAQPTAAPLVTGVTEVTTSKVEAAFSLPGVSEADFTDEAQQGVIVAIARTAGCHRSQVTLVNIKATGRRLQEAAPGVSFDVIIELAGTAAAVARTTEKIQELSPANTGVQAQEEQVMFAALIVEEMVKAVRAKDPSAPALAALKKASVVVPTPPVIAPTATVKSGCYMKAKVCPNKPGWVTGDEWRFHSGQTNAGKLSCLSENTSKSHHAACGMNQEQTWHMKWVDNTGSDIMTYPQPGCYFRLNECPKQPGWVTGATHWEADGWKFHQSRTLLGKAACIHTAYGHHLNCGLNARQASESMWIDQDSTTVTQYPEVLEKHPKCYTMLQQSGGVYKTVAQWKRDLDEAGAYSRLRTLQEHGEQFRNADGKFEFKIKWNDGNVQQWKQTNNPMVHPGCTSNCGDARACSTAP